MATQGFNAFEIAQRQFDQSPACSNAMRARGNCCATANVGLQPRATGGARLRVLMNADTEEAIGMFATPSQGAPAIGPAP